ncbi:MAG: type I DNA topoisomerase [Pseudomonadales bacterium]|jgi:DNA topoisomerase-1
MGKSLVIVESPAKAKTINKYLGSKFVVKSSVGHIRDLPTSGNTSTTTPAERAKQAAKTRKMKPTAKAAYQKKKAHDQLIRRMGIDPDHGWDAQYEILPRKEKVVEELQKLARNADTIYLATDLDREGEAIAWHLRETIGGDPDRYQRVVFNEITKTAIQEAFEEPGRLDIDRVNAQQARRFLDRVVGFMVSPLLWKKVARGLSAGRVQSVAVKLLVEREREIRIFVPEEFWDLSAFLKYQGDTFKFALNKKDGKDYKPTSGAEAAEVKAKLEASDYKVSAREDRPTSSKPSAPFITSTLQQAASTRLSFSVKKTMTLAQRLYEAGYITYMRTDSTNLSKDAVESCRTLISDNFGDAYLPKTPNSYGSKEGAQEAHEAIRPSSIDVLEEHLDTMEPDARRLYALIWRQFVACQMTPARYTSTRIKVNVSAYELSLKGRIVEFDGYTKVLPAMSKKDDDVMLPDMQSGDALALAEVDAKQNFTNPPARYSEASLVRELEKRGIGRPSTYAAIISTIQDRGYARVENRRFYAEKMGDIVTERLSESFAELMNYNFTADMESRLDDVALGKLDWKQVLDEFYEQFQGELTQAESEEGGMRANEPVATSIECPTCSRTMQIRTGSTGVFLGCSGYNLPPKERCKTTINLVSGDDVVSSDGSEEAESALIRSKRRCSIDNATMDSYLIDEGRKLHVCGNNPDCDGYEIETGSFRIKGYDGPTIECDKCGAEMQLKTGRFGKYFGCSNETCKNTRKLLKNGEVAPPKMDPVPMPELKCDKVDDFYVLRDGASGMFLAASGFPKNRETRAPLLKEIIPHRDEIDPKYNHFWSAPVVDGDGVPVTIRFSRKTKSHYVQSEVNGKPSGWRAEFDEDASRWIVSDKKKKAK